MGKTVSPRRNDAPMLRAGIRRNPAPAVFALVAAIAAGIMVVDPVSADDPTQDVPANWPSSLEVVIDGNVYEVPAEGLAADFEDTPVRGPELTAQRGGRALLGAVLALELSDPGFAKEGLRSSLNEVKEAAVVAKWVNRAGDFSEDALSTVAASAAQTYAAPASGGSSAVNTVAGGIADVIDTVNVSVSRIKFAIGFGIVERTLEELDTYRQERQELLRRIRTSEPFELDNVKAVYRSARWLEQVAPFGASVLLETVTRGSGDFGQDLLAAFGRIAKGTAVKLGGGTAKLADTAIAAADTKEAIVAFVDRTRRKLETLGDLDLASQRDSIIRVVENNRSWLADQAGGRIGETDRAVRTVVAVIDNSGSNRDTDPANLRAEALRLMVDTAPDRTRVGLVLFNDGARVQARPTALGPLGSAARDRLRGKIDGIGAVGGTDVAGGLERAGELLRRANGSQGTDQSVILLSDGRDDNWQGEVDMLPPGTPVHTIALSDQADRKSLSQASARSGGIAAIARDASDLHRIVGNLFGAAAGRQMLYTRNGNLETGESRRFEVPVEPGMAGVEFQVTWPGSDIDLAVTSPGGRQIGIDEAARAGHGIEARTYDVIRIDDPEPGTWRVQVAGVDLAAGGEPYTARAHAREPRIRVQWAGNAPVAEVGSPYNVRVQTRGSVEWQEAHVTIELPDGDRRQRRRALSGIDAMLGGGDEQTVYSLTPQAKGIHRLRIALRGRTEAGDPVVRMLDRTVRVVDAGQGMRYERQIDPFIRRGSSDGW